MFTELQDTIKINFQSIQSAYQFFCKNESLSSIPFEYFSDGINSLFPNRFSYSDIFWLWNKVKNGASSLTFSQFALYFDKNKGFKTKNLEEKVDEDVVKHIVDKVREILRSSNKSIEEIFKEFDKDGSGSISNVEFRNAFREMNLGLSLNEIDQLQNACDENMDGLIDWHEFVKKFRLSETGERILERAKLRMQKIREDIYYYMISPKDAFRLVFLIIF